MGCHTWVYKLDERYDGWEYPDYQNELAKWIKQKIDSILNGEYYKEIFDSVEVWEEWKESRSNELNKDLEQVLAGVFSLSELKNLIEGYTYEIKHYLAYLHKDKLYKVYIECWDKFRVGDYPEIVLESFDDCLKFIAENDPYCNSDGVNVDRFSKLSDSKKQELIEKTESLFSDNVPTIVVFG